jgi:hypothetical protein
LDQPSRKSQKATGHPPVLVTEFSSFAATVPWNTILDPQILLDSPVLSPIFPVKPFVSYTNGKTLANALVRAKLKNLGSGGPSSNFLTGKSIIKFLPVTKNYFQ